MDEAYLNRLFEQLRSKGVVFERGLSDDEVLGTEKTYGFRFPPDLRCFLQHALPVSDRFPDWRGGPDANIRRKLGWPLEGMIFDIEENGFWMARWGERPSSLSDAITIAKREVEKAPTLIPIYGHRYIPDEPPLAGNPVFSVHQTDIIYYGYDLPSYFANEFHLQMPAWATTNPRPIRFWDAIVNMEYITDEH